MTTTITTVMTIIMMTKTDNEDVVMIMTTMKTVAVMMIRCRCSHWPVASAAGDDQIEQGEWRRWRLWRGVARSLSEGSIRRRIGRSLPVPTSAGTARVDLRLASGSPVSERTNARCPQEIVLRLRITSDPLHTGRTRFSGGSRIFGGGAKGKFLCGGYITVTWYESQVNVMQYNTSIVHFSMNITHKCHLLNLCNKHKHIKLNLVKNVKLWCNTVYIDFVDF